MRYLVKASISGLVVRDGQIEEMNLPTGTVLEISRQRGLNPRLVEVTYDGNEVLLFTDDLMTKCERLG